MAKQFRGISDVFIAKVLTDTAEGITYETPKRLFNVATVSKEVESESSTVYLDNKPMIVISSEGADTITFTGAAFDLDVLAEVIGKKYDETLDMMIDTEREINEWAVGYKEDMTDGTSRYNWRYKGQFSIPAEEASTKDDGTDSTGQEITYTGVMTEATFEKAGNKSAKGVVVTNAKADVSTWFESVQTPDDVKAKA